MYGKVNIFGPEREHFLPVTVMVIWLYVTLIVVPVFEFTIFIIKLLLLSLLIFISLSSLMSLCLYLSHFVKSYEMVCLYKLIIIK